MHTVVMPKMGDTMEEGKILRWIKKEGDEVAKGDAIAEIETEKVNIEVESFAEGVLRKIIVPEGESAPVGAPIALTGTASEPIPAEFAGDAQAAAPERSGAQAEAAPVVASTSAREAGQNVTPSVETPAGATPATPPAHENGHQTVSNGRIFISPIARRIAAEHNLDVRTIQGTGPGGRIIREDVLDALKQQETGAARIPAQPAVPAAAAGEEVEAIPLSNMRKTIARRLQQSMQTAPHFYVTMQVDATKLGELRNQINAYAGTLPQPMKISFNDLIVKAVAAAITHMPEVNVSFDGERLLRKKHVNIGVAVALEQGLIVPVVRDADKRGVLEIASESRRLIDAARAGKLKPEDFQGGTFSVSNLGMYDVDEFTAIINPPEAGILAVGAIVPTPVVRDGQVVVRDIMKMTMSVDHRALDGATAARFLRDVKHLLEEPLGMLV